MNAFIHLCIHSTYSIVDGLATPKQLVLQAEQMGYEGLALTDRANLFGAVKFCNAAREKKIKPILGMTLRIGDYADKMTAPSYEVTLLAKNKSGYDNLMRLSTYAQAQARAMRGMVPYAFFAEHCKDLIILGGGIEGDVGAAICEGNEVLAKERLQAWQNLSGDNYYMELRKAGEGDTPALRKMLELAKECSCPPVATNNVMFLAKDDYETHRMRVSINTNELTSYPYERWQYLRSQEEMQQLFALAPEALENTVHIMHRCSFILRKKLNIPRYATTGSTNETLAELAKTGMARLLGEDWQDLADGIYRNRLESELQVIAEMQYSDYFLIVSDFVRWAKKQNIPVGPGRGSGAGSLVAYAIEITGLDPLKYNLLFERFLNKGRGSMPDFDIDVCMERREEVIAYIRQKYGEVSVAQIISFGTLGARAAIRDVTRILGKPYGLGDRIVEMIVGGPHIKLKDCMQDERLKAYLAADSEAQLVYEKAMALEGQVRHTGLHAAGVVITAGPVAESCPLYCDDEGKLLTQFDKDDLESIGLVKFDVLGLRTLTLINDTLAAISEDGIEKPLLLADDTKDDKTFAMIRSGETCGVFQLESTGMRDVAIRMRPNSLEDIVALIALYRPGPMNKIDDFIANKEKADKQQAIDYLSDALEEVLSNTYGIAVYQEQVMQMAQKIAGFNLEEADVLRYVMSKKDQDAVPAMKKTFIDRAIKNDYTQQEAEELCRQIEDFAGYGFNRSHAVGYAVLAYWVAFLKCHHPAQFMAAALSLEENDLKKTAVYIDEAKRLQLQIIPADINKSKAYFYASDQKIYYGLSSIKGLGKHLAQEIVKERENGFYDDLFDLSVRISRALETGINRRALESLIQAGALNDLDSNQERLMRQLNKALQLGKKKKQEMEAGISDMFAASLQTKALIDKQEGAHWSPRRAAREERKALGFYLRYDPFLIYRAELRGYVKHRIADLQMKQKTMICGLVYRYRYIVKNEQTMLQISLRDDSGDLSVILLPSMYKETEERHLKENNIIALYGGLSKFRNMDRFDVQTVYSLTALRQRHCAKICLEMDAKHANGNFLRQLQNTAMRYVDDKGLPLFFQIKDQDKIYSVRVLKQYCFLPEESFLATIEEEFQFVQTHLPKK